MLIVLCEFQFQLAKSQRSSKRSIAQGLVHAQFEAFQVFTKKQKWVFMAETIYRTSGHLIFGVRKNHFRFPSGQIPTRWTSGGFPLFGETFPIRRTLGFLSWMCFWTWSWRPFSPAFFFFRGKNFWNILEAKDFEVFWRCSQRSEISISIRD